MIASASSAIARCTAPCIISKALSVDAEQFISFSAAMGRDCGINKRLSERLQVRERAFFVATHRAAVAGDIRRQHNRKSPFHALAGQRSSGLEQFILAFQSIDAGSAGYNDRE
ncbi:hypothetical protein [Bradyrhizobium sp. LTSPM299]|uniref:hypothetical protein n=1 Tax=Bradyrhizobium sp. LTSPM299 TaxID=1619233 RepID=UPI0012E1CEDA|nr:hypothetical protein [Bradyrhizobium sp. LTSPM299]